MQENNNQNAVNEEVELSEILKIRRDKLTALCEEGKNPFEITKYDVTALSADAIKEFEAREEELNASGEQITVSIGGRTISVMKITLHLRSGTSVTSSVLKELCSAQEQVKFLSTQRK